MRNSMIQLVNTKIEYEDIPKILEEDKDKNIFQQMFLLGLYRNYLRNKKRTDECKQPAEESE